MPDNSTLPATGDVIRDLDRAGVKTQVVAVDIGGSSSEVLCSASNPMPVSDNGGSLTVDGTVAATQSGTWNVGTVTTVTTVSTVTAVSDAQAQGKAAHDAAASGNPLLVGAYASTAAPTNVSADGDAVRLWADRAGRLQVGDGGGSITVDNGGTFAVQAAQSGTWNVTNISGTVSLPTGAATSAKQPALGTAGTASADVLTVQGITSMTPLKVDGSAATQPVSGTVSITANSAVNVAQVGGVSPSMGNGVSGTGVQRVTIASDSTGQVALAAGSATVGAVNLAQYTPASGRLPVDGSGVTQPVSNAGTFAVQSTLQAGTALVGKASVAPDTSAIYSGTTALTPKFAKIAASSSGASTVVAAVVGKKIRVLALTLVATTAVTVKFQSHVTPTDLTGAMPAGANGGFSLPYSPVGLFETVSGEALDINLGGAVAVAGFLVYLEV